MLKKIALQIAVQLTCALLRRLRNGELVSLTREEFRFVHWSFSQFGEDLAVLRWCNRVTSIEKIYVDVGAYHPIQFSNTLFLHKIGWRGVNIDLDASRIEPFRVFRPQDFNVVAAVSSKATPGTVLIYPRGATDRLASPTDISDASVIGESPLCSRSVQTKTLTEILAEVPWSFRGVGYLNVDCEGHDLEVIKGLDFKKWRPTIITIEAFDSSRVETAHHLLSLGYDLKETIFNTLLFVDRTKIKFE